jgi:hypothetical protein
VPAVLAAASGARAVLVGGAAVALAAQAGLGALLAPAGDAPVLPGLALAAPLERFAQAGGLDPGCADGADLAVLDFALRVRRDAGAVTACRAAWAAPALAAGDAARLRRRFAAQWGQEAAAG